MRMNAKKKEKTRRETTAIKVWVTPAEKAAITVKADAYSLSVPRHGFSWERGRFSVALFRGSWHVGHGII